MLVLCSLYSGVFKWTVTFVLVTSSSLYLCQQYIQVKEEAEGCTQVQIYYKETEDGWLLCSCALSILYHLLQTCITSQAVPGYSTLIVRHELTIYTVVH